MKRQAFTMGCWACEKVKASVENRSSNAYSFFICPYRRVCWFNTALLSLSLSTLLCRGVKDTKDTCLMTALQRALKERELGSLHDREDTQQRHKEPLQPKE